MVALDERRGEGKGREIRTVRESATRSSDVGSKGRGSRRVATDLMENIALSLPQHTQLLRRIFTAAPFDF
jgi:hypothetical protein